MSNEPMMMVRVWCVVVVAKTPAMVFLLPIEAFAEMRHGVQWVRPWITHMA